MAQSIWPDDAAWARASQETQRCADGRWRARGGCRQHGDVELFVDAQGQIRCPQCRKERVIRRRRKVKQILVDEAGGRCALCGYDRWPGALHFHHVDPASKEFGLAAAGVARSLERCRKEARKCVLLCANCHAEVEGKLVTLDAPVPQ